ncbi:MAG: M20/M25/M40 family metallo-hydrolase [Cyanobacteriota bacterium]|nr:M20/M25/M40 family metallo-hydrolase [Cyanobacteriota bacterium]
MRSALRERLGALGPLEEHHFGSGSEAGTNLILRRPLLVGAHYDGPLKSPGADDNASGLVALLELARRWAASPPRRPVWLVAFDQEEWGMVGSAALAAQLKQAGQPLKLSQPGQSLEHLMGSGLDAAKTVSSRTLFEAAGLESAGALRDRIGRRCGLTLERLS